jgi:hypothetical protein
LRRSWPPDGRTGPHLAARTAAAARRVSGADRYPPSPDWWCRCRRQRRAAPNGAIQRQHAFHGGGKIMCRSRLKLELYIRYNVVRWISGGPQPIAMITTFTP